MEEFILFFLSFFFVLLIYEIFVVRKAKKKKGNNKRKEPVEVLYLVKKYHFDLKKLDYSKLLHVIAFTSSFDIALIVSIIMNIHSFIWELIIGIFSTFIIIFISYHIVYLFYKKKGMIKDE